MKHDILTPEDVAYMVDTFYEKVKGNDRLAYIFTDVAKIDWEHHMPRMYAFWRSIILKDQSYNDNPMIKHIALSKLTPLTGLEFAEWLRLFTSNIDEHFTGPNADETKRTAGNVARLMHHKVQNHG